MKAIGHHILVRELIEKKTESGLVYSAYTTERKSKVNLEAEVVSIGSLAYTDIGDGKPWCKVGDTIIRKPIYGDYYDEGPYRYRIINDIDVRGIVSEKKHLPLGKTILVKPVLEEDVLKNKSDMITDQSENQRFKVIAFGDYVFEDFEPDLKVGDIVRIDKYAGFNVNQDIRFIRYSEILSKE